MLMFACDRFAHLGPTAALSLPINQGYKPPRLLPPRQNVTPLPCTQLSMQEGAEALMRQPSADCRQQHSMRSTLLAEPCPQAHSLLQAEGWYGEDLVMGCATTSQARFIAPRCYLHCCLPPAIDCIVIYLRATRDSKEIPP